MHELEFSHVHPSEEEKARLEQSIWAVDHVELTTVGVDVGSSTSHLMFSKVHLQRLTEALSSRFVVVGRDVLYRSPILLTPYLPDYSIDADGLRRFIDTAYDEAGLTPDEIDSGAVILTGEALKRKNAEAIAHLFAGEAGKFVCASAGHNLEAIMAAHGSGAVGLTRTRHITLLNVDIGGGTTKLALVHGGQVLASAAFAIGGRLVAFDQDGRMARIEGPAERIAATPGGAGPGTLSLGGVMDPAARARLIATMVDMLVDEINRAPETPLMRDLRLTPPLPDNIKIDGITFSGGVSEFLYGRESADHGDLGRALADGLSDALKEKRVPYDVYDPGQGIRATVVGASQFSVQVSGNTIFVSADRALPLRNIPVIRPAVDFSGDISADGVAGAIGAALARIDLADGEGDVALAFDWEGDPLHARLHALADGIARGRAKSLQAGAPLIVVMSGDVARTLGRILTEELGIAGDVISIDGVHLSEFDYVDVGEMIRPANVVPLIIKSLLFAEAGPESGPEVGTGVGAGA